MRCLHLLGSDDRVEYSRQIAPAEFVKRPRAPGWQEAPSDSRLDLGTAGEGATLSPDIPLGRFAKSSGSIAGFNLDSAHPVALDLLRGNLTTFLRIDIDAEAHGGGCRPGLLPRVGEADIRNSADRDPRGLGIARQALGDDVNRAARWSYPDPKSGHNEVALDVFAARIRSQSPDFHIGQHHWLALCFWHVPPTLFALRVTLRVTVSDDSPCLTCQTCYCERVGNASLSANFCLSILRHVRQGRQTQRAESRLHRGGRGFESLIAHHGG